MTRQRTHSARAASPKASHIGQPLMAEQILTVEDFSVIIEHCSFSVTNLNTLRVDQSSLSQHQADNLRYLSPSLSLSGSSPLSVLPLFLLILSYLHPFRCLSPASYLPSSDSFFVLFCHDIIDQGLVTIQLKSF